MEFVAIALLLVTRGDMEAEQVDEESEGLGWRYSHRHLHTERDDRNPQQNHRTPQGRFFLQSANEINLYNSRRLTFSTKSEPQLGQS
jgi:hypothetical protein